MNRSTESLARGYQDLMLTEDEMNELDERLRSDGAAREAFLRETNLIAAVEDIACDEADVADTPHSTNTPLPNKTWRNTMAAGWVVAAAAAALLLINISREPDREDGVIATIVGLSGPLEWTGDGGQVRSDLTIGMELPGGTIDGLSPKSWFSLKFGDGSTVITSGNSMLAFSDTGQKVLHLKAGSLSADVSPQPDGRPMLIHTRAAVLEVLGTSFEIDTDLAATALNVTEGKVRVRRLSDGSQVEVPARHQVVAAADQDLDVVRVPDVLYQWRSRLEEGGRRAYGRWRPASGDIGPLLHCIPHTTEQDRTIYTSAFQVTTADTAPVMTTRDTLIRVEGQMERGVDLFVGVTLRTQEGEFAGRFQVVVPQADLPNDHEFEITLPLGEFQIDPSLIAMRSSLAESTSGLIVESVWCHTLYQPVGLAIASVELSEAEG